ncbi:MAG: hypothetical protein FWD48_02680 [Oscillospiraceae bacterium]|nr:hypothetical protein [Oscillospiraceae bacterium]
MRKVALLLALCVVLAGCGDSFEITFNERTREDIDFENIIIDETDPDYILLLEAEFFAWGGVGYAGSTPVYHYSFKRLFEKENALDYFYMLESNANNQGKLYALCALFYLDYDFFYTLIEEYSETDEEVTFMSGCSMIIGYEMNDLIRTDGRGMVRLRNNDDTTDDWLKRNFRKSFGVDFYGGGIPCMLMFRVERIDIIDEEN